MAVLLPMQGDRHGPFDLEIAGPAPRFLAWSDLDRDLPRHAVVLQDQLGAGPMPAEGVLLSDLRQGLGEAGSDVIVARCSDGYLSVFPQEFVERWRPVLILTLNGLPPRHWPPPGVQDNPGPYLITVSETLAPGVSRRPNIEHKEPWSVVSIAFGRQSQLFAGLAGMTPAARRLWIDSCASCHAGPPGTPGGVRSGVAFATLQQDAALRPDFVRRYVASPGSLNPSARMEPQPRDTGPALDELIACLPSVPVERMVPMR